MSGVLAGLTDDERALLRQLGDAVGQVPDLFTDDELDELDRNAEGTARDARALAAAASVAVKVWPHEARQLRTAGEESARQARRLATAARAHREAGDRIRQLTAAILERAVAP